MLFVSELYDQSVIVCAVLERAAGVSGSPEVTAQLLSALGSFYFPQERHTLPKRLPLKHTLAQNPFAKNNSVRCESSARARRTPDEPKPRAGAATPTDANKNTPCVMRVEGLPWRALQSPTGCLFSRF